MKKIILFLILLMPLMANSQSGYYNKIFIKDSIYSTTGIANFSDYYKDGVPFSSGGGDVYLGNRQTFSARNVFNDTLLSNAYAEFDNIKLTNYINFLGDIISDLGFLKGARLNIGTLDNYGIAIKTADTTRITIDSVGLVQIQKNLNVVGGLTVAGDISASFGNLTGDYLWGDGSNITGINASNISSGTVDASRLPELVVTKTGYISTAGAFVLVAHGIPDWSKLISFTFNILHDSTGTNKRFFYGGYNISSPNNTGFVAYVDASNFAYFCPATATGLVGDSVFFRATYRP